MYWPRLHLTDEEKRHSQKYYDPNRKGRGVLRRLYPGALVLTQQERAPTFSFQIARRCRVFGWTVSGDIARFKIQISDVTGEQHTSDSVRVTHLVTGYNAAPQGVFPLPDAAPHQPPLAAVAAVPYIFEPNIVLSPNQTLNFRGEQTEPRTTVGDPPEGIDYRIDFVLHVWEFPGMPGSPL